MNKAIEVMYGLTRQQIIDRLAEVEFPITDTLGNVFAANVAATHRRYIVDIVLRNIETSVQGARLRRVLADGTTRTFYSDVPVGASGIVHLNDSADKIASPLAILTRGQNVDRLRTGAENIVGTAIFWDNPRN